jgi:hypothetical protein
MRILRVTTLLAAGIAILAASALADVPTTISVQGRLTNTSGDPVTPGPKSFEFKIFNQVSGGTEIWPAGMGDEIQTISTDVNGLWCGQVGAVRALTHAVFESDQRWLEVTIDDGVNPPEVMPRTRLNTDPFAYRVGTVDGADGGRVTANLEAPSFSAGNDSEDGTIWLFQSGSTKPVVVIDEYSHLGGRVSVLDEMAGTAATLNVDGDGVGGYLKINGNSSGTRYVEIDGNASGTGVPKMSLVGDAASIVLDPHVSGNNSVILPESAINAAEMQNEPGVASETLTGSFSLSGGIEIIRQRSLTTPAAGWVLVMASCYVRSLHTQWTSTEAYFGVSDEPDALPANQQIIFYMTSNANTGNYYYPACITGLFSVSSGYHTFYFLGDESSGDVSCGDIQFSLIYFPTSYGSVTPTLVSTDDDETERPLAVDQTAIPQGPTGASELEQLKKDVMSLRGELEALKQTSGVEGR